MNTLNKPRALLSIIGITALAFTAISATGLPATADSTADSTAASAMASPADDTAPPLFPTVPSDPGPNDGFTVDAIGGGQVLEPGQAVRVDELQAQPRIECTPTDSDGISLCFGIGMPDPRAQVRPDGEPPSDLRER